MIGTPGPWHTKPTEVPVAEYRVDSGYTPTWEIRGRPSVDASSVDLPADHPARTELTSKLVATVYHEQDILVIEHAPDMLLLLKEWLDVTSGFAPIGLVGKTQHLLDNVEGE